MAVIAHGMKGALYADLQLNIRVGKEAKRP